MNVIRNKQRLRRRICRHCKELYLPDYRNRYHQRYRSKPACRLASKKAFQRRWLNSDKGAGYFKGLRNVGHVQQWRKAHPGYWKRNRSTRKNALQENCFSQPESNQGDTDKLKPALLIIDESGYLPVDRNGADLLFTVISKRYEKTPIALTTNKPLKKRPEIFNNDSTLTSAAWDRLLHHAEVSVFEGKSYRMKDRINE